MLCVWSGLCCALLCFAEFPFSSETYLALQDKGFTVATRSQTAIIEQILAKKSVIAPLGFGGSRFLPICIAVVEVLVQRTDRARALIFCSEEDKIGLPFVGAAGKLLTKMLLAINLKREDLYITNIIPWRPPNNRAPSNEEILQCLPFVQKNIELVNPNVILLLGSTAAKSILTTTLSITKLRGKWHQYNHPNLKKKINCLVTYHPAFLLRSPNYKKKLSSSSINPSWLTNGPSVFVSSYPLPPLDAFKAIRSTPTPTS